MESHESASELIERKVLRRGLIAGLAGLGAAALFKVTGPGNAQATDGSSIIIGNDSQTAQTSTRLTATAGIGGSVFQVRRAGAFVSGNLSAIAGSGGDSPGVFGLSESSMGTWGVSESSTGARGESVTGTGVFGKTNSGIGVRGESQSGAAVSGGSPNFVGVLGASDSHVGVRGVSASFVGTAGISTTFIGVYASNSAPGVPALYAENLSGSPLAGYFSGGVVVTGNFQVFGAKAAAVKLRDGSMAMMYSQEAPEPYFEDFGRAQLSGGRARVALDADFASLVVLGNYMVYLTPEGDTRGLYLAQKDAQGFEVREAQGGTSNVPLTYRVVAKRKDIPGIRLERLDPQVDKHVSNLKQSAASKIHFSSAPYMPGATSGGPGVVVGSESGRPARPGQPGSTP